MTDLLAIDYSPPGSCRLISRCSLGDITPRQYHHDGFVGKRLFIHHQEAEATSAAYIAGLVQCLTSVDVDIVSICNQVERFEADLNEKKGMEMEWN